MNPEVDAFITGATQWPDELAAMRPVLLATGLTEELKWRQPCYSHEGKNIVIMGEMKAGMTLGFFKGGLLLDPDHVLLDNGPNSRQTKRMFFTSVDDVERLADTVTRYVNESVAVELSGATLDPAPEPELAAELQERLDADPKLKAAFEALTPGRRRYYNIHITEAKQSATRSARVEKCIPKILAGKGLQDR